MYYHMLPHSLDYWNLSYWLLLLLTITCTLELTLLATYCITQDRTIISSWARISNVHSVVVYIET